MDYRTGAVVGDQPRFPARTVSANLSRAYGLRLTKSEKEHLRELQSQFFCYAIASRWSQSWLTEKAKGVAYTGINIRDLKRLPLPIPPISEQIEIVRRAETLLKCADAIERRVEISTRSVEKLTQAILAKAFRGELVPTEAELARREGREYESASVLLARIAEQGKLSGAESGKAKAPSRRASKVRR